MNIGRNAVRGLVAHSAEGSAANLLDLAVNGPLSWHASNLKDGRFVAHFPFTAQCWHATAFNPNMVGIENEGVAGEPLTEAQISNLVRVSKELQDWKGYSYVARLTGYDDPSAFLLGEHNQVSMYGGSATECPSGRIPWGEILSRLNGPTLHVSEVVKQEDLFTIRFAGSGTLTIGNGDEWKLLATDADVMQDGTQIFSIQPPS